MPRDRSKIPAAKSRIIRFFESEPTRNYNLSQLKAILSNNRHAWGLAQSVTTPQFLSFLQKETLLQRIELTSERHNNLIRYMWGEITPYQLALSIRPRSYLSHGTAAYINGLTSQIPDLIHVNYEQAPKSQSSHLTQEAIHRAFTREQRVSNYAFRYGNYRILVVSGKYSGDLEVIRMSTPEGDHARVTKLERTLIDLVVRPSYAGGVQNVLGAFRAAQARLSISILINTLKRLDFTYPYHQAIGFLMERTGYDSQLYHQLAELGTRYDFYLAHGMKSKAYDSNWRLYYPADL